MATPPAPSRSVSVTIDRNPDEVYVYLSNPENFPVWAAAFCRSIRKEGADWLIETPNGPMRAHFVERNAFRVLDHYVTPAPGVEVYVPMRVVANGSGSEVVLTIFRLPDMSDGQFEEDIQMVQADLNRLKQILEQAE